MPRYHYCKKGGISWNLSQTCKSLLCYEFEGESTVEKNGITELGQVIIICPVPPPYQWMKTICVQSRLASLVKYLLYRTYFLVARRTG